MWSRKEKQSTGKWKKENSEVVEVEITSLFADDTTIIGKKE